MRKNLLTILMLFAALVVPWASRAQSPCAFPANVVIGDSTSTGTSYYTPVNTYYNYSLTETIIDADEIGGPMTIESISFYYQYSSALSEETSVTMWLQPTTKSVFSSSSDMEVLDTTIAVQIYTGAFNCTHGWNTITFTTPYNYNGLTNLMLIVDDNSGDYDGNSYVFKTTACTGNKTLHWYSDTYNPVPTSSSYDGSKSVLTSRVVMKLNGCDLATCHKPTIDSLNYSSTTASIYWHGGEVSNYLVTLKKGNVEVESTTTTFGEMTYSTLEANTVYTVSIRTLCTSVDTSAAASVTFRTECAAISTLPYQNDFENEPYYLSGTTTYAEAMPMCWTRINDATGTYNYYPYINTSSTYLIHGEKSMYWYHSTTASYANNEYAVLPPVDLDVYNMTDLTLSFYAKTTATAAPWPLFIVGVMDSANVASTFVPVDTITLNNTAPKLCVVNFANYEGDGAYIAIRCPRPTAARYASLDDIYLTDAWCDAPTHVAANSTVNSITITWDSADAGLYEVVLGNDTIVGVTDNYYTFTDLTPDSMYTYAVAVSCTDGNSLYVGGSISTLCANLDTLPYVQTFEGVATGGTTNRNFVNCMLRLNNGTQYFGWPYVGAATYNHTTGGNRGLYWYNNSTVGTYGDYQIVVLPGVDATQYPINTLQLKFWARASSSSSSYAPVFQVGVMTNPNDASTFTTVGTVHVGLNNATWTEFTTPLANYTGEGNYVAIRALRETATWYAYVDDITLEEMPSCPPILNLTVEGTTVGAALLTWDYMHGTEDTPSSYDVICDSVGSTATPVTMTATGTSYAITGLAPSTAYKAYVRANCGGGEYGEWDSITFNTGNFACEQLDSTSLDTVNFSTGTTASSGVLVYSGYGNTIYQTIYKASELTAAGLTAGPIIGVDFGFGANSSYAKEFTIFMANSNKNSFSSSTDLVDPATMTQVYGATAYPIHSTGGWRHFDFTESFMWDGVSNIVVCTFMNQPTGTSQTISSFSGYSTSTTMTGISAYRYKDSNPYTVSDYTSGSSGSTTTNRASIHFYTGECAVMATCSDPSLSIVSYDSNTVNLAWIPGASETSWNLDYRVVGDTAWTSAGTALTVMQYSITGLNSGTEYEFRVSHLCGTVLYASTANVITLCVTPTLPYDEGFESIPLNSYPICWDYVMTGTATYQTGTYLPKITSTYASTDGGKCLYLYGVGLFSLPEMPVSLDTLMLSFSDLTTSATAYGLIVGVMEEGTFVPVDTIILDRTYARTNYRVLFDNYHGTSRTIAFKNYYLTSSSTYYSYHYIDDIHVEYKPECMFVSNLHMVSTQNDSVTVAWTPYGTETEWEVSNGFTTQYVTTPSALFTELSPSTYYTFSVRAICNDGDTSAPTTLTARTACGKLTSLPYVMDFEYEPTGTSEPFVGCWTRLNNGTDYSYYPYNGNSTTYNHTPNGAKGLYWYGNTTTGTYGDYYITVLPEVDTTELPINNLMLTFWAKPSSTSYEPVFYIGVMSNKDSVNSFQYYDTIMIDHSNTEWQRYTVLLDGFTGNGSYVAIRGNRPTSIWYAYMDDITLDVIPACAPLEDIVVVPGVTSAMVTWSTFGTNYSGAIVEYKDTNSDATWNSVTVTGDMYARLTGLDAATPYMLRLKAVCPDANSAVTTAEFATRDFGCGEYDSTTLFNATIGTGETTNTYIPSTSFYNYGYSQQFFTASELGTSGVISKITITPSNVVMQRTYEIYMGQSTDSAATSFINPTGLTCVYNGGHIPMIAGQPMTFELTTPFNYSNSSNLVVIFSDVTGPTYVSGNAFEGDEAWANVSRYVYNDNSPYVAGTVTGGTASNFRNKITFFSGTCLQQATCAAPVAILTDVTTNSATVAWAPGANETSWNLYYRRAADTTFILAAADVTTMTYTFTGLNSGINYEFKVENNCVAGNSATVKGTTECAAITSLPFVEDFNTWGMGTGKLPACWYRTGTYSTYTYISASQNMTGVSGGSVYMYSSSGSYISWLILPELETTLYPMNQVQLVFNATYTSTSYGAPMFIVGVMSDPLDNTTFVPVDTVTHSGVVNQWDVFEVPLSNYADSGRYVALRTLYGSTYTYPYVDDVSLEVIPTCLRPDSLTASNATTTTIDLAWHDRSSASQWIVEYGPVGFTPGIGVGTVVNANSNPFTLTGVPVAFVGEYYVKAVCGYGDTGDYSRRPCAFNTQQIPATLPYNYDFEDGTEWANWQTSSNHLNNNWYRGTAVADSGNYSIYISANAGATYKPYQNNAIVNAAAYRDIDFGPIDSSYTLSFRARAGGTIENYYDGLMVFLVDPSLSTVPSNNGITSPWGNVNDLYRIATVRLDTVWHTHTASFDTISGVHRVAFFWFNQNTSDATLAEPAAVDNIHIDYSSCPRPLSLDTVAVAGNTAVLSWRGAADGDYQVVYRVVGGTNQMTTSNTNSVTLTGLNSNANYLAWVRKVCGVGDTSLWSDGVSFQTKMCDGAQVAATGDTTSTTTGYTCPVNNLWKYTLTETIIDSAELGGAMDISSIAYYYQYGTAMTDKTDVTIYLQPTNKTTFASSSDYDLLDTNTAVKVYEGDLNCSQGWNYFGFINNYHYNGHGNLMVIVDDNSGDYNSSTYVFKTVESTGYKTIGFYSDTENPDVTDMASYSGSKTYYQYRPLMQLISCGGGNCDVPLVMGSTPEETSITVTVATADSSAAILEAVITDQPWSDAIATTLTPISINYPTENTFTFNGLTALTDYTVAVRTRCGSTSVSDWVPVPVTTLRHPCYQPTAVTVTNETYDGATVSWTIGEEETSWEVNVHSNSPYYDTNYIVNTTPTLTVTGLDNGTTYTVTVRALCFSDWYSDWTAPKNLTTVTCPTVSDVTSSNVTANTATITWTDNGAVKYEVEYGTMGFQTGTGTMVPTTTNSLTLTGLEEQTVYDVFVRGYCTETVYSGWSTKHRFTTAAGSTGIADVENGLVTLFPNPASSVVTIAGLEGESIVTVVDLNGREVFKGHATGSLTLDVTGYAKGAYFVRVTGESTTAIRKLIVR